MNPFGTTSDCKHCANSHLSDEVFLIAIIYEAHRHLMTGTLRTVSILKYMRMTNVEKQQL